MNPGNINSQGIIDTRAIQLPQKAHKDLNYVYTISCKSNRGKMNQDFKRLQEIRGNIIIIKQENKIIKEKPTRYIRLKK